MKDNQLPEYIYQCRAIAYQRVIYPVVNGVSLHGAPEIVDGQWEGRYTGTAVGRLSKQTFYLVQFPDRKHPDSFLSFRAYTIFRSKWYTKVWNKIQFATPYNTKKECPGEPIRGSVILEDQAYWPQLTVEFFLERRK